MNHLAIIAYACANLACSSSKPAPSTTPSTPTPDSAPGEVAPEPEMQGPPMAGLVRRQTAGFTLDVPPECELEDRPPIAHADGYLTSGAMCTLDGLSVATFTHTWDHDLTEAELIAAGEKTLGILLLLAPDAKFEARRPISIGGVPGEEITWHLRDRPAAGRMLWTPRKIVMAAVLPLTSTPGPLVRATLESLRLLP